LTFIYIILSLCVGEIVQGYLRVSNLANSKPTVGLSPPTYDRLVKTKQIQMVELSSAHLLVKH